MEDTPADISSKGLKWMIITFTFKLNQFENNYLLSFFIADRCFFFLVIA